jgi:hypothetical protein
VGLCSGCAVVCTILYVAGTRLERKRNQQVGSIPTRSIMTNLPPIAAVNDTPLSYAFKTWHERITVAIREARNNTSRLLARPDILDPEQLKGFSNSSVRHLLNNLGRSATSYLEIGLHQGSTFISTLAENQISYAMGIDNWSWSGGREHKKTFQDNTNNLLFSKQMYPHIFDLRDVDCFQWIYNNQNYFTTNNRPPFDLFFYDGGHTYIDQLSAIKLFFDSLARVSVIVVDDYASPVVKEATMDAFRQLSREFKILSFDIWSLPNGEFWEGLGIHLVEKPVRLEKLS